MTARRPLRFASPELLTPDTKLFHGFTAREWNKVFLGDMQKTLTDMKARMDAGDYPMRDVSTATSFDLASAAKSFRHR
jgi:hypothetical protein